MNQEAKNRYRRKGKLFYRSRAYKNPFFTKQGLKIGRTKIVTFRPVQISWRFRLSIIIFLFIVVASVYFFFYSNYFMIKTVKAEGEGRIRPEVIEKIAWQQIKNNFFIFWPQENIFLFQEDKLIKTLNDKYAFSFVEIIKKLPTTIFIRYKEKEYDLVWHERDKFFYADREGNIISEISAEEAAGKSYPLFENQTGFLVQNRKITAGEQYLKYALRLAAGLEKYQDLPKPEKYIIDQELNTVKIKFKNGPLVYFNIKNSADKQIRKLIILKQEKLGSVFFDLSYIDLRYGDSVYYR